MVVNKMKVIGITGGVGAGKTEVLHYIEKHYPCRIVIADEVAHMVKEPGQICYEPILELLGNDVLQQDGTIDKKKMADIIFSEASGMLLKKINVVIHPAVKEYILTEIDRERRGGHVAFFFIEAALLIEDGYTKICDELWYVFADWKIREERLRKSRGYSDEKIMRIMKNQASEELFRKSCKVIIDNSKSFRETEAQVDYYLKENK